MENLAHNGPVDQRYNPENQKILLSATLRLYMRRTDHGLPVTRTDILRLAYYFSEDSGAR